MRTGLPRAGPAARAAPAMASVPAVPAAVLRYAMTVTPAVRVMISRSRVDAPPVLLFAGISLNQKGMSASIGDVPALALSLSSSVRYFATTVAWFVVHAEVV